MRLFQLDESVISLIEAIEKYTTEEVALLFDLLKDQEGLDAAGLTQIIKDTEWPRGGQSLKLALLRMFGVLFGKTPTGISAQPGWYDVVGAEMIRFAQERGYNVDENLKSARLRAQEQRSKKQQIKKRAEEVRQEFTDKFADTYRSLNAEQRKFFSAQKENMLARILLGKTVDEILADTVKRVKERAPDTKQKIKKGK